MSRLLDNEQETPVQIGSSACHPIGAYYGYGEVACPTRPNRLRPKRLLYWLLVNTAYYGVGTKGAHHTSITKGITKI